MQILSKEFLELTEGCGEMGRLIREVDWSRSTVGPFERWPQSLKTALSVCLGSKFPMFVWWGKDLTVFYNDSYIPFTGLKHPNYLGRPAREQWAEIWDALKPLTDQVLQTGKATWAESMQLFMTRKGFLEETYFTFSYSPIRDESGAVGGIINPCQETTFSVLGQRRLTALHNLGAQEVLSVSDVGVGAARVLAENTNDIPFALIYAADSDNKQAALIGSTGFKTHSKLAAQTLHLSSPNVWKLDQINKSRRPERIGELRAKVSLELPKTPYEEGPNEAYVMPLNLSNRPLPAGFLVLGVSPRLEFDRRYEEFFALIAAQIATQIFNIQTLEEEKKRAEALAEIDRAKTTFFSNVSHEFRTPLTLILGPLSDLIEGMHGTLNVVQKEQLHVLQRNALRLLRLVNSLLDFSRLEAGRAQANFEPLDLSSLTSGLANAFHTATVRAGLKLIINCDSITRSVYVDKDMWEKIVLNLISNAFKYTHKGEIEVTLKEVAEGIELKIRDTGIGISETELPKVFERFHRVEGAHGRTHEGTGIGLSLVKELVKLHGGSISVESALGQGTTFTIKIPVGKAHLPPDRIVSHRDSPMKLPSRPLAFVEEALRWAPGTKDIENGEERPDLNESLPPPSLLDTPKKTIVLADDNDDMREYVRKLLVDYHEVIATPNGKEALEATLKHSPDLIVSDVMMPIMDGVELLKAIRSDPKVQRTPIILLSARAGDDSKASGIEIGADDYVTKPFSAKELLARVNTQLKLSETRNRLLHDLEFSNRELEAFSRSVSHDLRSPLRSMAGFSKILLEDEIESLSPKGKDYLIRISEAAERMGRLIDGLLRLSRVSRRDLKKDRIDLSRLVEKVASHLRTENPSRDLKITVESGLVAMADSQLIEIAIQNLLNNAVKFTSKKPNALIHFGVTKRGRETIYFVSDNGAGFDMHFVDKLFGVFQRLHKSEEFEGTGIGLATVKRIIERHSGRIWAESKLGEGAIFYFTL